jgi:capsular exopolysaccharide synthesis family protein
MDLRTYLHFLRHSWEWITASTLIGVTVAMAVVLSTTPKFAATSELFLATPGYSATGNLASYETSPYQADVFTQQRARSYVQLASRADLARRVVEKLGLNMRPEDLANATSSAVRPDTVLIKVTVKSSSPIEAKVLADAVTAELANDIRILEMPSAVVIPTVEPVITQLAITPSRPSEPNIVTYLLFGASTGFLAGVTAAAWLQRRRAVVGPAMVEQATDRPVLGAIRSESVEAELFGNGKPPEWEATSRQWRKVYHSVVFEMEDTPDRVIAVIQVNRGEGTHAAAASLAYAFARNGSRTALVATETGGFDYLLVHEIPALGLAGAIAGELRLDEAIRPTDVGNLHYLGGPVPENPAPLLQSEKFRGVVDELRESFDMVIFDAPGFLRQAESTLWPAVVDSVILIVTDKITSKRELSSAVRLLRDLDVHLMGTILMPISIEERINRPSHSLVASDTGADQ